MTQHPNPKRLNNRYILLVYMILLWTCPVAAGHAQSAEVLQWELNIRYLEHLDSTETYSDQAILFVGSSSIRLWSTLAEDMAPFEVIQRGYGGAKLSDLVYYAERIIYPHSCRAIVVFVANDIVGNNQDKSPAEVTALVKELLEIIRGRMPGVPVFYIATTPTPSRWQAWSRIREANKLISDLCRYEENTWFIETEQYYLDEDGQPRPELFRGDMLHLNADGYRIWTGIIRSELWKGFGN